MLLDGYAGRRDVADRDLGHDYGESQGASRPPAGATELRRSIAMKVMVHRRWVVFCRPLMVNCLGGRLDAGRGDGCTEPLVSERFCPDAHAVLEGKLVLVEAHDVIHGFCSRYSDGVLVLLIVFGFPCLLGLAVSVLYPNINESLQEGFHHVSRFC